jgi:hypothetical protein
MGKVASVPSDRIKRERPEQKVVVTPESGERATVRWHVGRQVKGVSRRRHRLAGAQPTEPMRQRSQTTRDGRSAQVFPSHVAVAYDAQGLDLITLALFGLNHRASAGANTCGLKKSIGSTNQCNSGCWLGGNPRAAAY